MENDFANDVAHADLSASKIIQQPEGDHVVEKSFEHVFQAEHLK